MDLSAGRGMVVTLEAMARECVAVALSPESDFSLGKTYVVHFGASGNVSTVIRRRLPNGTEAIDVSIPSRVCQERVWVPYWLCLNNSGQLYVGTGKVVGKSCIGKLDDGLYHQLRSPIDAVKFVGLGNSALGRNARPLKIRNVCVTTVPDYLSDVLAALPSDLPLVTVQDEDDSNQAEMQALMEEYQKECQKNKARAAKFGIPYKEPSPQAFLQWSKARKLRANPEKGFITGMDVMSPEEIAKQEARKARFGADAIKNKRKVEDGEEEMEEEAEGPMEAMEEEKEPLPIVQAWDNETLVSEQRKDPPGSLWANPPPADEEREDTGDDFAMESAGPTTHVPEKVHIFSIDWVAFKQIRTPDIMSYFKDYGPSYVEWLGELSCNVLFEDKFSAARALQHLSQDIPSPPPPEAVASNTENQEEPKGATDFGNMTWRFCRQPIRKVVKDRYGRIGTTARLMMRTATTEDVLVERPTSWPAPPPGFSTKRVLGPGSDFDTSPPKKKRRRGNPPESFDHTSADGLPSGLPPGLDGSLQAGRGGFTIEEIEAERARKREASKTEEPGAVGSTTAMDDTENDNS